MSHKDITWRDVQDGTLPELKKSYKMNDRQVEQSLRKHMDGASAQERSDLYAKLYGKRK